MAPVRSNFHHNPAYGSLGKGVAIGAGAAGIIGLLLIPSLVVAPFVIKQFKPKMSYGKRVALGMAIGLGVSLIREALTPAEVKLAREQERIRKSEARDAEALARAKASEARLRAEYEDTLANIPPGTFFMPSV